MIEVAGVTKRYGGSVAAADVSFHVAPGEVLALVGDSGSGKATTLKMINRLAEPDAGPVRVDGRDTVTLEPHVLRRSIGYVLQGAGLFPHRTVAENVAVPLRLLGWPRERIDVRVAELLALVELDEGLAGRLPAALSGGEQQRGRCRPRARGLAPRDAARRALDPLTRDRLQRSFDALRRRLALTAVFVTHDMAETVLLADRIGVMRGGRLVQLGSPAELVRAPADEGVARMLDTPRRQARLVADRLEGRA